MERESAFIRVYERDTRSRADMSNLKKGKNENKEDEWTINFLRETCTSETLGGRVVRLGHGSFSILDIPSWSEDVSFPFSPITKMKETFS